MDNFILEPSKYYLNYSSGAGLTTEFILPLLENIPLMKAFLLLGDVDSFHNAH
jgi:hypothetical protein